ncbi:MAG: hypothetical protein O3B41_08880 [Bacteroidetes bacterium]|nr:hypothetical protein [Bacteroidota bacterium]
MTLVLLLSACASSGDKSTKSEDSTISDSINANSEHDKSVLDNSTSEHNVGSDATFLKSILSQVPELDECQEMMLSQKDQLINEPSRITGGYANVIEIPCGAAPGTGAHGYPMSLVVEWEAMPMSSDGPMPLRYDALEFFERNKDGSFVSVGYVTQAIIYGDEDDLGGGYIHLLYKYAGAGQCGMLVTYSSEAWRTPFEFREARERTCDAEPCDDESCYQPKTWDLVFSTWN